METVTIGLGEIGRSLYEILRSTFDTYGYDVREEISPNKLETLPKSPFLHIAYPYLLLLGKSTLTAYGSSLRS